MFLGNYEISGCTKWKRNAHVGTKVDVDTLAAELLAKSDTARTDELDREDLERGACSLFRHKCFIFLLSLFSSWVAEHWMHADVLDVGSSALGSREGVV